MSSILFEKKRPDVNTFKVKLGAILAALSLSGLWLLVPLVVHVLNRPDFSALLLLVFSAAVLVGSVISLGFIRIGDWRRLMLIAGLVSGVSLLAAAFLTADIPRLVAVGIAGLFSGFGLSVAITCLGDTRQPASQYGALLSLLMAGFVLVKQSVEPLMALLDDQSVFWVLGGLALLAMAFSRLLPISGAKRISLLNSQMPMVTTPLVVSCIGGIVVFAGLTLLWWLRHAVMQGGLPSNDYMLLVYLPLLGGLVAMFVGDRWGYLLPVGISAAAVVLSLALIAYQPQVSASLSVPMLLGITGLVSLMLAAYVMGLVARLDQSGQVTPLVWVMVLVGVLVAMGVVMKLALPFPLSRMAIFCCVVGLPGLLWGAAKAREME